MAPVASRSRSPSPRWQELILPRGVPVSYRPEKQECKNTPVSLKEENAEDLAEHDGKYFPVPLEKGMNAEELITTHSSGTPIPASIIHPSSLPITAIKMYSYSLDSDPDTNILDEVQCKKLRGNDITKESLVAFVEDLQRCSEGAKKSLGKLKEGSVSVVNIEENILHVLRRWNADFFSSHHVLAMLCEDLNSSGKLLLVYIIPSSSVPKDDYGEI
ncbi:hypothetical protein BDQ17DRAFT_1080831 [Cyathus striatus]|nr:hypothetical protein BDQ17DRAFT_1080831 [Cyathus striatus]